MQSTESEVSMTDEMYTIKQAAIYAGVDEATIRLAVRREELRAWALPLQRGLLVRKSQLQEWVKARRENEDRV